MQPNHNNQQPFYEPLSEMEQWEQQEGAAVYLAKVMGWMCIGLLTTCVTALFCIVVPSLFNAIYSTNIVYAVVVGQLVLAIFFTARLRAMSSATATVMFLVYSAVTGITMSFLILLFDMTSILFILGMTGLMFLTMAIYGFVTKSDLTTFGRLAMFGLFGIILTSMVNIFMRSATVDFVVSAIAIVVFIGLIAYDTQKVKNIYLSAMREGYGAEEQGMQKLAIYGAFMLYLDFINLFIRLLQIFGRRRR